MLDPPCRGIRALAQRVPASAQADMLLPCAVSQKYLQMQYDSMPGYL